MIGREWRAIASHKRRSRGSTAGVPSSFVIGHEIVSGLCFDPPWIWRAVF